MKTRFLVFILSLSYLSSAQNVLPLKVVCADKAESFFQKKYALPEKVADSVAAANQIKQLIQKLISNGYAAASADSLVCDTAGCVAYIYGGEPFAEINVQNGNVDDGLLSLAGVRSVLQRGKPVSVNTLGSIKQRVLRACENSGYPFAEVRFQTQESGLALFLEKRDLIKIDTLTIQGKTKVKRVFLKNYLGLKTNKPYNEANVRRVTQRLNELQFAEVLQPHTVTFQNGKAGVYVFLKDRKASQVNFLLGVLPGSSGQKALITGEARIHLFSPFGMGEELFLEWQKLQPKTQRLDVRLTFPYIAGLPLGINARFELYKRDSSYLDIDGDYGVQYQIIGSNYLRASVRQKFTFLLNPDTLFVKNNRQLPRNLDISTNEFALEFFQQKLDYRFNPTSGYVLKVQGSAGLKQIRRNNTIAALFDEVAGKNFSYLYDTARLRSFQFKLGLSVDKYWRLAARHTIKTSFDGRYFFSRNVFENEKYRLGGVSSLRGFDDQSIFTPYYAMANLEYRFLLSRNSYFSTFFNAAVVEDNRNYKMPVDFPYGFGAGAALETKAGIFGLTYAMGTQLNNKFTFRSAKIHFGYVNYF